MHYDLFRPQLLCNVDDTCIYLSGILNPYVRSRHLYHMIRLTATFLKKKKTEKIILFKREMKNGN